MHGERSKWLIDVGQSSKVQLRILGFPSVNNFGQDGLTTIFDLSKRVLNRATSLIDVVWRTAGVLK
jgi:hypothetical protein